MKNNKIIFLDIDGVIAVHNYEKRVHELNDIKQDLLGFILDKTDAKIVLSSSWRLHNLTDTIVFMKKEQFRYYDHIIGVTVRGYHCLKKGHEMKIQRGVEIQHWIDENTNYKNRSEFKYVIIDDDSDMLLSQKDNFIKTDSMIGLTEQHADKCIKILNG